ncbi:tristetraprolin-like zinc finger protein [Lymphocystis disease virus 4]|uniref:Tristetraprolin-like zinc finger protein n=1 Tax=Lymphocystis disease virus 4 TaxID=2704413 RepID=A0A6B9XMJ7_9VIRU|nr:tristetraprolin-like zinc finger protein [Lymphocystis disease virus 4]QHR78471.1 tristetraprolin-like zinc finger protein [Lymphocystis disease virus 4]
MSKYNKKPELDEDSEDLFDPEKWAVESEDEFSDNDDEEYEAEFYSEEDSDDEEADINSEEKLPKFDKKAHLKKLNDRYKQNLIDCFLALEGKLKWTEFKLEPPPPFEPEEVCRIKKDRTKAPRVKKWIKTSDVKIIIDDELGVCFVWKVQKSSKPCKYLVEGQVCPFGPEKCHHNHGPPPTEKKPQLCKYIKEDKPCPFKAYCLYQHEIIQINRLCKYYKNQQSCPFKDKCMYKHESLKPKPEPPPTPSPVTIKSGLKYKPEGSAICKHASKCKMNLTGKCKFLHTRKDIKSSMKSCPRGNECDAVKLCPKKLVNKQGQQICYYKNINGGCGFVHPQEELDAFAYRMTK